MGRPDQTDRSGRNGYRDAGDERPQVGGRAQKPASRTENHLYVGPRAGDDQQSGRFGSGSGPALEALPTLSAGAESARGVGSTIELRRVWSSSPARS